ncbi:MAG: tRNA (adenosine(37)-N6)-threonylcarbamoyltransferase complex transferase subunit TsaD [Parcubacteria group bacterium]|jgi:N6-L-threonylcarbamoyladenine synthase
MNILAIETSCDDTAVAIVKAVRGKFSVIESFVSSQIGVHAPFGGVVPDLAAREHLKNLPLLLKKAFSQFSQGLSGIDLIAVTQGPGLIPALLIGTNAAKSLAYASKKPLVGVNHIEGHIYANFVREVRSSEIKFPILALVVSGGHTELILMKGHLKYKVLGQTMDDAAGEAFDKVAKILGLGYPGGPAVSAYADKFPISNFQFPNKSQIKNSKNTKYQILNTKYQLPRPMLNSKNYDFSFSGLKTAVLYTIRDNSKILQNEKLKSALCYEFQQAVIDVLVHKTLDAAKKYKPSAILLGGGVSANRELRRQLGKALKKDLPATDYFLPDTGYSLDNAAMIAVAGYYRFELSKNKKRFASNWKNLEADARLSLKS